MMLSGDASGQWGAVLSPSTQRAEKNVGKGTELGQFVTGLFIRWKSTDGQLKVKQKTHWMSAWAIWTPFFKDRITRLSWNKKQVISPLRMVL